MSSNKSAEERCKSTSIPGTHSYLTGSLAAICSQSQLLTSHVWLCSEHLHKPHHLWPMEFILQICKKRIQRPQPCVTVRIYCHNLQIKPPEARGKVSMDLNEPHMPFTFWFQRSRRRASQQRGKSTRQWLALKGLEISWGLLSRCPRSHQVLQRFVDVQSSFPLKVDQSQRLPSYTF